MKERWGMILSFQKYTSLNFISSKVEILLAWERQVQGDEKRMEEDCYADHLISKVVIPYSEPYAHAYLTRGSHLVSAVGLPPLWLHAGCSPWLSVWL